MKQVMVMLFACSMAACTMDDGSLDQQEQSSLSVPGDPQRAALIAKIKLDSVGGELPTAPQDFAACGVAGSTAISVDVRDAALVFRAPMRNGSAENCLAFAVLQGTDEARYFCWTCNADCTATYTYTENLRNGRRGWVLDAELRSPNGAGVGGARNICPGLPGPP